LATNLKGAAKSTSMWLLGLSAVTKAIVSLAALAVAIGLILLVAGMREDSSGSPEFPADGPAEFLYLDSGRVIAYLAQIDGGTFSSKTLTHKLTDSAGGKVGVKDALEITGTVSREDSVSRVVTPTAAANYFELLGDLEDLDGGLERIGLRNFGEDVRDLTEGQLVMFETHALRPPVYLNSYLALRTRHTVSSLFPVPEDDEAIERRVETLVHHSLNFRDSLGKNPRVVFALRPLNKREIKERRRRREADKLRRELVEKEAPAPRLGQPRLSVSAAITVPSREEIRKRVLHEEEHVQYLMPLDAQLLTRERSLLKYGGGTFTVVGKVVRIFPSPGNRHRPAYLDSPTTETWAQPLSHAPLALLCRTDPRCTRVVRRDGIAAEDRLEAIERSRARALETLIEQTAIPRRGAVILPIAIYK
jgi:hypothetical protein